MRVAVLAACVAAIVVLAGRLRDRNGCRDARQELFTAAVRGGAAADVLARDARTLRSDCHDVDDLAAGSVSVLLAGVPARAVSLARGDAARARGSWTNCYSPRGGHDLSPYHYPGPRLYERRHGPPCKNPYGAGLWARHIGPTLKLVRERSGQDLERVEARCRPQLRVVCRIPGRRELVTWNCVIRVWRR